MGQGLSKRRNALHGKDDVVAVLLHMCKHSMTACLAVADMDGMFGLRRVPAHHAPHGPGGHNEQPNAEPGVATRSTFASAERRQDKGRGRRHGQAQGGAPGFEGYAAFRAVGRPGILTPAVLRTFCVVPSGMWTSPRQRERPDTRSGHPASDRQACPFSQHVHPHSAAIDTTEFFGNLCAWTAILLAKITSFQLKIQFRMHLS